VTRTRKIVAYLSLCFKEVGNELLQVALDILRGRLVLFTSLLYLSGGGFVCAHSLELLQHAWKSGAPTYQIGQNASVCAVHKAFLLSIA
jgi:hypothetical protein